MSLTGLDFSRDSRPVFTRDDRTMFTTVGISLPILGKGVKYIHSL